MPACTSGSNSAGVPINRRAPARGNRCPAAVPIYESETGTRASVRLGSIPDDQDTALRGCPEVVRPLS